MWLCTQRFISHMHHTCSHTTKILHTSQNHQYSMDFWSWKKLKTSHCPDYATLPILWCTQSSIRVVLMSGQWFMPSSSHWLAYSNMTKSARMCWCCEICIWNVYNMFTATHTLIEFKIVAANHCAESSVCANEINQWFSKSKIQQVLMVTVYGHSMVLANELFGMSLHGYWALTKYHVSTLHWKMHNILPWQSLIIKLLSPTPFLDDSFHDMLS